MDIVIMLFCYVGVYKQLFSKYFVGVAFCFATKQRSAEMMLSEEKQVLCHQTILG